MDDAPQLSPRQGRLGRVTEDDEERAMGYDTEYLGHLEVTPPLNRVEVEWLSGFADWGALPDGDPFTLPMNPRAALATAFRNAGDGMTGPRNIPRGTRDWRVSDDGTRISWRRAPKSNDAVHTLTFLVETYLGVDAAARSSGNPDFVAFTFDHRLDGLIVGERDDTEELFLLEVRDSIITHHTIVPRVERRHE
ncbi:MAG: hypothetical protein ACRCSN_02080 [Dermatophilaceae bacterium]